jgi:rabenosyn-5
MEVSSLAMNVEDLSREIDRVSGMLASLDFEGVYTGKHQYLKKGRRRAEDQKT